MTAYKDALPPIEILVTFEAVGRQSSFTGAASELSLTQSAVSKQIRQLEDFIGVQLFERRPRGVALTNAGEDLMRGVDVLLDAISEVVRRVRANHHRADASKLASPPGLQTEN